MHSVNDERRLRGWGECGGKERQGVEVEMDGMVGSWCREINGLDDVMKDLEDGGIKAWVGECNDGYDMSWVNGLKEISSRFKPKKKTITLDIP